MADLHNLLGGLKETQNEESTSQEDTENVEGEKWEDTRHFHIPPALEEASRRKRLDAVDEEEAEQRDLSSLPYVRLKNMWSQELHCPELLPFDEPLFRQVTQILVQAEEQQDQLTCSSEGKEIMDSLFASFLAMDAQRVKFLLCDWLRLRLNKIEAFPLHMRTQTDKMSNSEIEHLKAYGALVEKHLNRTVLDHFPQDVWKKLDEDEMIDEPDLDCHVLIRTKAEVTISNDTYDEGTILIIPYNRVKGLMQKREIELVP